MEEVIENLKSSILRYEEGGTEERRKLVRDLIEARLQLSELVDDPLPPDIIVRNSHHFTSVKEIKFGRGFCQVCGRMLWSGLSHWMMCKGNYQHPSC